MKPPIWMCIVIILHFLTLCKGTSVNSTGNSSALTNGNVSQQCVDHHKGGGISLASFRWSEIGVYFTISAFVVVAGFAKLGFHKLSWLSSKVPESCLLVILGLIVGIITYFALDDSGSLDDCTPKVQFPQFSSELFFLILLPPIILDSAYALHDRVFLDNLGTVLVFAVIGSLFNIFAIGASLYGVNALSLVPEMQLSLTDAFVFSSLISAVDPVAVLAIFQELGVNQNLYFLIFGESLLNDGVTVVLYNTMQTFRSMTLVTIGQVLLAILSFFIVTLGGVAIGIFYGLFSSLATKWTHSVRVVEPLAVLGLAYLSYLSAELFHFSGIISLIVCGIIQAHYGFYNISHKSYICVKYFTKMASATSDTVIFMFLGMVLINEDHEWNAAFVLWTILFCLAYRFISVFLMSAVCNIFRGRPIDLEEQFIAAYGGLRGAVAFSLATTMDKDMNSRNTLIFTTLMVILFTVFVQGITIKPMVYLLNIKRRHNEKKKLGEEIVQTSIDHVMAGIEEILGHHGDFYLRELIMFYNEKYLKKFFMHECGDSKLTRLFEKICLAEHYAHLYGSDMDDTSELLEYEPHLKMDSEVQKNDDVMLRPKESNPRRKSIKEFLSRKSSAPPTEKDPSNVENSLLRRALRDNHFNKLHYKYNPNLVHEEDQELEEHLNRRALNAQRRSMMTAASARRISMSSQDNINILPGQVPSDKPEKPSFDSIARSVLMLQRHHRRHGDNNNALRSIASLLSENDDSALRRTFSHQDPPNPREFDNVRAPNRNSAGAQWKPEFIPLVKRAKKDSDKEDMV